MNRTSLAAGTPRLEEAALFALRCATGVFLLYQSHDNVLSQERMAEFAAFMGQFGFWRPDLLAPFAIFWQVAAGVGLIAGLLVRPLGLITAVQFIVAVAMVHRNDDFAGWWPALILVFLGFYFAARGGGRYALDTLIRNRRHASYA